MNPHPNEPGLCSRRSIRLAAVTLALVGAFASASSVASAKVNISAGEPTGQDYQDLIGGGGTVQGDIFGGEQVRPAPDRLVDVGDRGPAISVNSSRAARLDVAWHMRLWSWIRMTLEVIGFAPTR